MLHFHATEMAGSGGHTLKRSHKQAVYGAMAASFALGFGALLFSEERSSESSRGIPWDDLLLLGIAAHKISRIAAKDRVTQPARAPFTKPEAGYQQPTGGALRYSVGELVTCPYCLAPWVSLGLGAAYLNAPSATRLGAGLFTMVSISDFLNRGYARLTS